MKVRRLDEGQNGLLRAVFQLSLQEPVGYSGGCGDTGEKDTAAPLQIEELCALMGTSFYTESCSSVEPVMDGIVLSCPLKTPKVVHKQGFI